MDRQPNWLKHEEKAAEVCLKEKAAEVCLKQGRNDCMTSPNAHAFLLHNTYFNLSDHPIREQ